MALAFELGGEQSTVLVLTDHPPPNPNLGTGRLRWWALGKPLANGAFVNARRTPGPRGDRLLLEVANLAQEARTTNLRVEAGQPSRELRNSELRLAPGEAQRVILELTDAGAAPTVVRAAIGSDDLPLHNSSIANHLETLAG